MSNWKHQDGDSKKEPLAFVMRAGDTNIVHRLYAFACNAPFSVVGLDDMEYLAMLACGEFKIIAAWGQRAKESEVLAFVDICNAFGKPIYCISTNEDGSPKHPLYVSADTPIVPWVTP